MRAQLRPALHGRHRPARHEGENAGHRAKAITSRVGGGFGENRKIGRQIFSGVPVESLGPTLEAMLKAFLARAVQTTNRFTTSATGTRWASCRKCSRSRRMNATPAFTAARGGMIHEVSLIDRLLESSRRLATAVRRFSQWHDDAVARAAVASGRYRDLIPLSRPGRWRAICLRGQSRPVHWLQGVCHGVPQPERTR